MEYRPAVDILRLIAAASIVCFHSKNAPYKTIAISGLSYFILLTFCLQAMSELRGRSPGLRKRAMRLLVPWILWSLFYVVLKLARHQPVLPEVRKSPGYFLVGPEIHLWFLPFAFLGGIAGSLLLRIASRLPVTGALLLLGLISAALAMAGPLVGVIQSPPFGQWTYALPLLPVGLAIGLCNCLSRTRLVYHYCAILALTLFLSWRCVEPSYFLGTLVLLASILPRSRDLVWLKWLAGLSMGIYLLHPAVFLVIYKFYPAAPWYAFASISFFGSAVASALIMPFRTLACLAFGTAHRPPRELFAAPNE